MSDRESVRGFWLNSWRGSGAVVALILAGSVSGTAQAVVCAATEVAHSDHAATGSVTGAEGAPILITCDSGYEGGGVTFCQGDTTFYPVACTSYTSCDAPPGTSGVGHYIEGEVEVFVGTGVQPVSLRVQRHQKDGSGAWTEDPLTAFSDTRCPPDVYRGSAHMIQEFYYELAARGLAPSQIAKFYDAISGQTASGLYIEDQLPYFSYAGNPGSITLGSGTDLGTRRVLAHESAHGWEWEALGGDEATLFDWYATFTAYANEVYHTRLTDPETLEGTGWSLDYLNYGLQNDAEWGAEVFQEWLYGCCGGWAGNWIFMEQSLPEFEDYFDCLWEEGDAPATCLAAAFTSTEIDLPDTLPYLDPPTVSGFTTQESQAAWDVCFGRWSPSDDVDAFDDAVLAAAPDLPGSPADHYELAIGDCNHDGTLDWLCWYTGPGPTGIGNGSYLWNEDNEDGALSFISSGLSTESYAEYLPDLYFDPNSTGHGFIAPPAFREWQGTYGSCNGARLVSLDSGFGALAMGSALGQLGTCSILENLADPGCISEDVLLWLDASDASTVFSSTGLAGDSDEVVGWRNKGMLPNDAGGYTSGKRPTLHTDSFNGRPAIQFVDDILEVRNLDLTQATTPAFTAFAVIRVQDAFSRIWVSTQNGFSKRSQDVDVPVDEEVLISTVSFEDDGETELLNQWINGVPETVDEEVSLGTSYKGIALGQSLYAAAGYAGAYPYAFEVGELIVVRGALSDADRAQIHYDLASRWGIPLSCTASSDCGDGTCVNGTCMPGDLLLWLDASEPSTLLASGGVAGDEDEIVEWSDKGPHGNDALSNSSGKRPVLETTAYSGSPAVVFSDDFLEVQDVDVTASSAPAVTSIAVFRHLGGYEDLWVAQQNAFSRRTHTAIADPVDLFTISTVVFRHDSGTDYRDHWLGGEAQVLNESHTFATTYPGIGLGQHLYSWDGHAGAYAANYELAELLVVAGELSEPVRTKVEADLAAKWDVGVASSWSESCTGGTDVNGTCLGDELLLWLDAQDSSTLYGADGPVASSEEVIEWRDKGSHGHLARGYASAKRPTLSAASIGSAPAVSFDASFMELRGLDLTPGAAAEVTTLAVFKRTGSLGALWVSQQNGFSKRLQWPTDAAVDTPSISTAVLRQESGSEYWDHWLNGTANVVNQSVTLSTAYPGVGLGQGLYAWDGHAGAYDSDFDLGELVIIEGDLSSADRLQLQYDLAAKWGITLSCTTSADCGSSASCVSGSCELP